MPATSNHLDTRRHHPLLTVRKCLIQRAIIRECDVLDTLYTTFPAFHEGFWAR